MASCDYCNRDKTLTTFQVNALDSDSISICTKCQQALAVVKQKVYRGHHDEVARPGYRMILSKLNKIEDDIAEINARLST